MPDDVERIAAVIRWARRHHDVLLVTGGLGPTPDDVTREAIARALGAPRTTNAALAERLHAAGGHMRAFAAEWALLPGGARVLHGIEGGAPAFALENVYVLAGEPTEMRSAFDGVRGELRAGPPLAVWRRSYRTTEDVVAPALDGVYREHGDRVAVGCYARYELEGPRVEIVLRAGDEETLASAVGDLQDALAAAFAE